LCKELEFLEPISSWAAYGEIFSKRIAASSGVLEKEWALKISLDFSYIREATCVFLPISIPK